MLDKKIFQRQVEECRELARHAVNAEDRAFWLQTAEHWKTQVTQIEEKAAVKKLHD